MRFRILATAFVALLFAVAQTVMSGASLIGDASAYAASIDAQRPASTTLQDTDDDSEEEDDEDTDNEDDDGDNEEYDDNVEDDDDVADDEGDTVTAAPTIDDDALKQPLQQASGTSNGTDALVATPGERVAVRIFPWMPAGVQVTIRPIDPTTVAAAPGTRAGDLMFALEARDASGAQLASLPAEVNLAIRYADTTVSGLNEEMLIVSRLDPTSNQWQAAPKLVRETASNYVAASVTELGTYVVSAQ